MRARWRVILLLTAIALLTGCAIQRTLPVYRIGVVLPLEGAGRPLALDVFFASRAALLQALASDRMNTYRVELVTLDDFGDPVRAADHAASLAIDPALLVVIGHWLPDTTAAALPVYREAGLPLIATIGQAVDPTGEAGVFVLDAPPAAYEQADALIESNASPPRAQWLTNTIYPADLPDGDAFHELIVNSDPSAVAPGPYSALAYDAVNLALNAIHRAAESGPLTRESVTAALAVSDFSGLTGSITFDSSGFRRDAPLFLYDMTDKNAPVLLERFP